MRFPRLILWLILSVGAVHAAPALYDCPAGGFAFTAPAGWEIKTESGEPFPTLSGPVEDLNSPYVVIKAIHDKADIFDLGDATIKEMLKDLRYSVNVRDAFETADREFGMKVVFSVTETSRSGAVATTNATPAPYRQAYYFVNGPPGTVYAVLATVAEPGWKKSEHLLDEMMKSYHLRPVVAGPAAPAASSAPETKN
jgi:hypothetical protein